MVTLMQHRALCSVATLMLENPALAFHNALGQTTVRHDRATQNAHAKEAVLHICLLILEI